MAGVVDLSEKNVSFNGLASIGKIFDTIGQQERARRNRQMIDSIVAQTSAGKSPEEAIVASRNNPVQYDRGVQGMMQRIGGAFAPSEDVGDDLTEQILLNSLKESMKYRGLSPEQIAQAREVEAGIRARPYPTRPARLSTIKTADGYAAFNPETGEATPLEGIEAPQGRGIYKPVYDESGRAIGQMDLTTGEVVSAGDGRAFSKPLEGSYKVVGNTLVYVPPASMVSGGKGPGAQVVSGALSAVGQNIAQEVDQQTTPQAIPVYKGAAATKSNSDLVFKLNTAINNMEVTPNNYDSFNALANQAGLEIRRIPVPEKRIPAEKNWLGMEKWPEQVIPASEEYALVPKGQGTPSQAGRGVVPPKQNPEFESRMTTNSPVIQNSDGSVSSHKMSWATVDNGAIAYPTIVNIDGKLTQLDQKQAIDYALSTGEYKKFETPKQAEEYAAGSWKNSQTTPGGGSPAAGMFSTAPANAAPAAAQDGPQDGPIEVSNPDLLQDIQQAESLINSGQKDIDGVYNAFLAAYPDPADRAVIDRIFKKSGGTKKK